MRTHYYKITVNYDQRQQVIDQLEQIGLPWCTLLSSVCPGIHNADHVWTVITEPHYQTVFTLKFTGEYEFVEHTSIGEAMLGGFNTSMYEQLHASLP